MTIQLINDDILHSPAEAVVIACEKTSDAKEGCFENVPGKCSGLPGNIFAYFPDLSECKLCSEDYLSFEQGLDLIEDFFSELFLYADRLGICSISIPLFGTELFADGDNPVKTCSEVVWETIYNSSVNTSIENVYIRFNDKEFKALKDEFSDRIPNIIEQGLRTIECHRHKHAGFTTWQRCEPESCDSEPYSYPKGIMDMQDPFGICLDRMMQERDIKPGEFVHRANISRQTLSKLRNRDAVPEKYTALACALALELSYEETEALLKTAGYCLSDSITVDVIVSYFIRRQMYDIDAINIVLFSQGLRQLGARASSSL